MDTERISDSHVCDVAKLIGVTLDAFELGPEDHLKVLLKACRNLVRRHLEDPWRSCSTAICAEFFASLWSAPLDKADRLLTEREFCAEAGLTAYKLQKLRNLKRLLYLEGSGGVLYPEFQAHRGQLLDGVISVNAATSQLKLNNATRLLLMLWPCFPDDSCIVEALRQGRREEAVAAAASFRGFAL